MSGSAPPCTPSPSPAPSRQRPRQRPASPARGLQRPSAPLRWSDGFVAAAPLRAGCETGSGAHCLRHRPFRPRWHSVNGSKLIQKSIYDLSKWCVCPAVTNGCRSWLVVLYVKLKSGGYFSSSKSRSPVSYYVGRARTLLRARRQVRGRYAYLAHASVRACDHACSWSTN
ncbi:hypothetical protein PVAP13_1KG201040 [Panicum virgatum]|uniref:Uncharacterized protein n=1 Tax=Panicum virgatum TaxID=38727 RepID=A0A8T0XKP8_PANVG|nr:hypothetical protein PVAP13_1KG201040 [Panicum virgatum]